MGINMGLFYPITLIKIKSQIHLFTFSSIDCLVSGSIRLMYLIYAGDD